VEGRVRRHSALFGRDEIAWPIVTLRGAGRSNYPARTHTISRAVDPRGRTASDAAQSKHVERQGRRAKGLPQRSVAMLAGPPATLRKEDHHRRPAALGRLGQAGFYILIR
jgi:hypothetical protein